MPTVSDAYPANIMGLGRVRRGMAQDKIWRWCRTLELKKSVQMVDLYRNVGQLGGYDLQELPTVI